MYVLSGREKVNTPDLFYESWLDALKDDVRALGGAKVIGCILWAEKDPLSARNRLNDCLNPERRETLTHEQELLIMRKAKDQRGFSAALFHLCDEIGFERPRAKDPYDETAALQREFIEAIKRQERIAQRLEALTQAPVRAVSRSA